MKTAAFIFDVDGTLAETEESHRHAFNATFAAAGLGWHWDPTLYGELLKVTGGKERIRAFVDGAGPVSAMSEERIAVLHSEKTKVYADIIARGGVCLRPGVRDLIGLAKSLQIKVAMATTTTLPNVDALCVACWGQPLGPCSMSSPRAMRRGAKNRLPIFITSRSTDWVSSRRTALPSRIRAMACWPRNRPGFKS